MSNSSVTARSSFKVSLNCFPILATIFLFVSPNLYSQNNYYGDYLSSNIHNLADEIVIPSVQSPDVAAFQKNSFLPTSNFSGRVDVTIPIYTIQHGGMEVPISLSYNTSGVKVADMASRVGLNWSLNAGGVVSRVIQGLDDFTLPNYLGADVDMKSPAGWLAPLHPLHSNAGTENPNDDALPDKYIIRAPGLGTEFVPRKSGAAMDLRRSGNIFNPLFAEIQKSYTTPTGSTATYKRFALKNLQVTSINGIHYNFETPDLTRGYGPVYDVPANYLDQMINVNTDEKITFQYESFSNYYYDDLKLYTTSYGGGSFGGFADKPVNNWFNVGNRLKRIDFETGSVEFIYGHDRQDYPGEKALTRILIKDVHGKAIKDFRFSYSYFESSIEAGTPESKRLRLENVYEVDSNLNPKPGYSFTYQVDPSYTMPPRDSYAYDFLGYNNGSYSSGISDPSPKMYFYNHKITPLYRSSAIELPGNFSMAANSNFAKTYSLKKITLPTGGSQEFDYELNQFIYQGQMFSGGGLRVKTQYLKAGDGTEQAIDYQYSSGTIGLMPSYASFYMKTSSFTYPSTLTELTNQLGIDTFSSPRAQIELLNGSFVGYQWVKEIKRNGPGYTTYSYTFQGNTPSVKSHPTSLSLNTMSTHWRNLNDGLLFIDNDFMRGLLEARVVYNSSNEIVHRTRNVYELQEIVFGVMNKVFYNVVHNSCSNRADIFMSPSEAFSSCGGFKEVIDLKPSRYVLEAVRSTDYALEGESSSAQDETQGIFVEKKYLYDPYFPLITTEFISNYESDDQFGGSIDQQNALWETRKDIIYPVTGSVYSGPQVNAYPHAQDLYNQNRVSIPMEVEISGRSYSKQKFEYADFGGGLLDLKKISTELRNNVFTPAPEVLSRNIFGRPTEIKQTGGKITSIVYGYNNREVIAIIDGANYSNINSWLFTDYGKSISYLSQISDLDKDASSESTLKNWLKNLRNSIESRSGNTTTVKTFTHDPLVGTTSITDERGTTSTYQYDQLKRLQLIKNDDSQIKKYFNYNFRN